MHLARAGANGPSAPAFSRAALLLGNRRATGRWENHGGEMIATATTGRRMPAKAWSDNDEERRKALFSVLREGVPLVTFDNLRRGASISCPHIEKACTAATIEDRVLGKSESQEVQATTVIVFTGNNISPKGDLVSRSLVTRIEVDRADPENRDFKHPDPIGWTLDNRARLLAALYTILLGAPRRAHKDVTCRFKMWGAIVGWPLEYAAKLYGETLDFGNLFAKNEDEEDLELAEGLEALAEWASGNGRAEFPAAEVTAFLNKTFAAAAEGEPEAEAAAERRAAQGLAAKIRNCFLPRGKDGISPKIVAKALKNHTGNPVMLQDTAGDCELTLKVKQDKHTKTYIYFVERKWREGVI